jgi:Tfp pilus assembly protein PilN
VQIANELAQNVPKRVWLTSFEEKNGSMILEGGAVKGTVAGMLADGKLVAQSTDMRTRGQFEAMLGDAGLR